MFLYRNGCAVAVTCPRVSESCSKVSVAVIEGGGALKWPQNGPKGPLLILANYRPIVAQGSVRWGVWSCRELVHV